MFEANITFAHPIRDVVDHEHGSVIDQAIQTYLARQRVAHLATADAEGRPHVVPMCYALAETTLYSVIDTKPKRRPPEQLRRVANILKNPRVAVVIDTYSEAWTALGFVLLEGSARIVRSGPEHSAALRLLREKYSQYQAMALEDRPVIAVSIARVVRWGELE